MKLVHEGRLSGFSLIEVLVAMLVIVVGCLGALSLQVAAMRGTSQADYRTVATFLAESEIERLRSLPFGQLCNEAEDYKSSPLVEVLDAHGQSRPSTEADKYFTRTVRFYPGLPTTLSNQIEVEVAWTDVQGPHRIFYSTAVTSFTLAGRNVTTSTP